MRYIIVLLAAITLSGTLAFAQLQLPTSWRGQLVGAYIAAFNSGNDDSLRQFFLDHVSKGDLVTRPLEARITRAKEMRNDLKSLTPVSLLDTNATLTSILAKTGSGETVILAFETNRATHMLAGLRVEMGGGGADESGPPLSRKQFAAAAAKFLGQEMKADRFSGAVLVARGSNVLLKKAYGVAEKRFHTPNRINTKFNLGSINKFFTKLAIAQLAEQGKLSLGDTLIKLLPDYPNAAVARRITINQIVTMTSGLGDFFGERFMNTPKDQIRTLEDYLKLFVNDSLLFEPGTSQRYSNAGYIVLGLVIEKLSGQDYYSYVRDHIFMPAGMWSTNSYTPDDVTPNLAAGYAHPDSASPDWVNTIYTMPGRGSSAGGGYSTVEDLYRFLQALQNGKLVSGRYASWMLAGDLPKTDPPLPLKQGSIGIAGGAPGINGAVEFDAATGNTVIVLGNYGPPAAMNVAAHLRGMLKRMR